MNNTESKTRGVVFRMTKDEFTQLQSAAAEARARSVSAYAKSKLLGAVGEPSLVDLGRKLDTITSILRQVNILVETSTASRG